MKKIANKLAIELVIEGKGLVNRNGSLPPERFRKQMLNNGKVTSNGTFGKEVLTEETFIDKDGEINKVKKAKKIISSNLLRKMILGDENQVNADKLVKLDALRASVLSQEKLIARGYCVLDKNNTSIKRGTGVCVSDAIQISDTITTLETRTSEGLRDETSLFFVENCGDITYQSTIDFDIKHLKFISIDDNYDRMSLLAKDVESYINNIDSRYGEGNAKLGNWGTTHTNLVGEQGIVLSNKVVTNIIREVVIGILGVNIKRSGSYAKTSGVRIGIAYPDDKIGLLIKPNFVTITSIEEYDELVKDIEFGVEFLEIAPPTFPKVEKEVKEKKK